MDVLAPAPQASVPASSQKRLRSVLGGAGGLYRDLVCGEDACSLPGWGGDLTEGPGGVCGPQLASRRRLRKR